MKVERAVIETLAAEVNLFKEIRHIEPAWIDNFGNCNAEVMNVIAESDSELKPSLITQIYGDDISADDWCRLENIEPKSVPWFGRIVNLIRFGVGYVGNAEQGDQLFDVECLAMNFSYRAYWACGSNFMIRAVVGRYLGRSSRTASWPWPDWNGIQRNNQIQWLASIINTEMQKLREFYDVEGLRQAGLADVELAKPPLQDFRALLRQIDDAEAIEQTSRQNRRV